MLEIKELLDEWVKLHPDCIVYSPDVQRGYILNIFHKPSNLSVCVAVEMCFVPNVFRENVFNALDKGLSQIYYKYNEGTDISEIVKTQLFKAVDVFKVKHPDISIVVQNIYIGFKVTMSKADGSLHDRTIHEFLVNSFVGKNTGEIYSDILVTLQTMINKII